MQLILSFLEIAEPATDIWTGLDHDEQRTAVDKLAAVIARSVLPERESGAVDTAGKGDDNHD